MPRRWETEDGWREEVYYAVVESYRDERGRPRHRTIAPLGTRSMPGEVARDRRAQAEIARAMAEDARVDGEAEAAWAAEQEEWLEGVDHARLPAYHRRGHRRTINQQRKQAEATLRWAAREEEFASACEQEAARFEELQRRLDAETKRTRGRG